MTDFPGTTIPNARVLSYGSRRVLASLPNGRQYGHQALEMALAYAEGRRLGLPVYFVGQTLMAQPALFELKPEDIEVLRPSGLRRVWLESRMKLSGGGEFWQRRYKSVARFQKQFLRDFRLELRPQLVMRQHHARVRETLKRFGEGILRLVEGEGGKADKQYYYHRGLLRSPIRVALEPAARAEAERQAAAAGINPGAPIVTLHMREGGYKLGAELQDTKGTRRDESVRNTRVESYLEAIDYLVGRGFQVVRIGDPSMTPLRRTGVVDLATSTHRSGLLELHAISRSHFLIGCDSGPSYVTYLTGTPLVCVNCTAPVATYPIRAYGIYILKPLSERRTGRRLRLAEMLLPECDVTFRDTTVYRYHDNSSGEILEVVHEMLALLEQDPGMSPAQAEYKEQLLAADLAYRPTANYIRKWGSDAGFIGDGRIGRAFAERYR